MGRDQAEEFMLGTEFQAMRFLRAAASQIGHQVELVAEERHFDFAPHAIDAEALASLARRLGGVAETYAAFAAYVGPGKWDGDEWVPVEVAR